ncbi:SLAP domain-containing protein [Psychrobacillus sp. NPDC058041]|uniref:SLAP domain-containing protein n=1 Tax=Psychrobacillus sp. NPDC058041 TaxID=3346310 RepID=UPI0036DA1217
MQKLDFEPSWDKTLSSKDRKEIEKIFLETNRVHFSNVRLVPIRQAFNHKKELLVTVLIHNFTENFFIFSKKRIAYVENSEIIAENTFTLPTLFIQPKTSMPWTFIFPEECLKKNLTLENGRLEIM